MKNLLIGLVLGILLSSVITVGAGVAGSKIIGSGYLTGVDVTDDDGDTICSDPFYYSSTKELQCD
jgi:hypothetical protein